MHTFAGWGDAPITDRSAQVDELPETEAEEQKVFWYHFVPPLVCIVFAVALTFLPGWQYGVREAAARVYNQAAYLNTVYTGHSVPLQRLRHGAMKFRERPCAERSRCYWRSPWPARRCFAENLRDLCESAHSLKARSPPCVRCRAGIPAITFYG